MVARTQDASPPLLGPVERCDDAGALADGEADIVRHRNEDHADAVTLYAVDLPGLTGAGWTTTGIDPDGVDLSRENGMAR